jgi:hypothetical protein
MRKHIAGALREVVWSEKRDTGGMFKAEVGVYQAELEDPGAAARSAGEKIATVRARRGKPLPVTWHVRKGKHDG